MTTPSEDKPDSVQDAAVEAVANVNPRIRLGERLSQARQARDISIADASDRLRIRGNYLQALESGDWTPLPEEVYVMGFLRQYASLLGVDISSDIEALKTGEYMLTKPFTMPDPPIAMNRTWAIVASACFVLLLILFNVVDEGEKDQVPAQAPDTISLAPAESGDTGPTDTDSSDAASIPGNTDTGSNAPILTEQQPEPVSDAAGSAASAADVDSSSPAQAGSPAQNKPATPTESSTQTASAAQAASATQTEPEPDTATSPTVVSTLSYDTGLAQQGSPAADNHDYTIGAFGEDVWLQVHAPDGSLIKEALLRRGQSMRLSSNAAYLLLTAGNPLALKISIDEQLVTEPGTLGEKEKVLRDYRLTPPETGSSN